MRLGLWDSVEKMIETWKLIRVLLPRLRKAVKLWSRTWNRRQLQQTCTRRGSCGVHYCRRVLDFEARSPHILQAQHSSLQSQRFFGLAASKIVLLWPQPPFQSLGEARGTLEGIKQGAPRSKRWECHCFRTFQTIDVRLLTRTLEVSLAEEEQLRGMGNLLAASALPQLRWCPAQIWTGVDVQLWISFLAWPKFQMSCLCRKCTVMWEVYWVQTCKVLTSPSFQRELRTQTSSSKNTNFRVATSCNHMSLQTGSKSFQRCPDQKLLWWFLTKAHFKNLFRKWDMHQQIISITVLQSNISGSGCNRNMRPWCLSSMIILDFQIALLLWRSWGQPKCWRWRALLKLEVLTVSCDKFLAGNI